jgi:spore maturation protein CgeB
MSLNIVVLGLSITSSWGNGHATTYRALLRALAAQGHTLTFIERDVPWYRDNRDLTNAEYCDIHLYQSLDELALLHAARVRDADLVIVGSYVPDGIAVCEWALSCARGVTAFYDIDTPITLNALANGACSYLSAALVPRFDIYLSFSGGPALTMLEEVYGSPAARPLYCSAEPRPDATACPTRWSLGYLGTYSDDRQPTLDKLLLQPAVQLPDLAFAVAGPQYPDSILWPSNVTRIAHLPPAEHEGFYLSQRYTLNVTRADMRALGYSPSVRLFEAAAFGVPIISDDWDGLSSIFRPDQEILVAGDTSDVLQILQQVSEERRRTIAAAARARFLAEHTPSHRAVQLESYHQEALQRRRPAGQAAAARRQPA